jgi:flagellar basal-body rod modification protein FlgD
MTSINTGNSNVSSTTGTTGTSGLSLPTNAQSLQNEFLTLFTTQLKNQDPLNPMDSSQMTGQLAQISTVTGIQNLNTTMQSLMSANTATQAAQAAGLIGHTVMGSGQQFTYSGSGSSTIGITVPSAANSISLEVVNGLGQTVRSYALPAQTSAGSTAVVWDGKDSAGNALGAGTYTVKVSATANGTAIQATPLVQGVVSNVTVDSTGVNLAVQGVGSIPLSSVTQIN